MESKSDINWFPGHMAKAIREIKEKIKIVDCIIEIIDARAPISSRNPLLCEIKKERLIIMSKKDLADPKKTKQWIDYLKKNKIEVIEMDLINDFKRKLIIDKCINLLKEKFDKEKSKGLKQRPIIAMVVGIPNVGKSTFINKMSRRKSTRVANTPGYTKAQQWVRSSDVELLDTPGILWPKFKEEETGVNLALIGTIKETILNKEILSELVKDFLISNYPYLLKSRYNLNDFNDLFLNIAIQRGLLVKGGEYSIDRAREVLLNEFKTGRIGQITMEVPDLDGT